MSWNHRAGPHGRGGNLLQNTDYDLSVNKIMKVEFCFSDFFHSENF